jgi:hypothetical protein
MLATMLSSYAGDGAAEVTWLWHNVDVESCCYVMMAMELLH